MWWFPIASMSETTKGTCSSWGYIFRLYSDPLYHRGDLWIALTNVYIISQKKTPAKRGRILVLSDLCEDPNKKIDIDAIEHAPRVYSISLLRTNFNKDIEVVSLLITLWV